MSFFKSGFLLGARLSSSSTSLASLAEPEGAADTPKAGPAVSEGDEDFQRLDCNQPRLPKQLLHPYSDVAALLSLPASEEEPRGLRNVGNRCVRASRPRLSA